MHRHFLLLAAAVVFAGASVAGQQEARFSARSDLVVLHVAVTDKRGGFVSGLPANAFQVLEEGRPQPVSFFAEQDAPATIGLLIDASGSMLENRDRVVAGITAFVEASHPDDEFLPVVFNEQATPVLPPEKRFTSDSSELREALTEALGARGRTAFHDALAEILDGLAQGRHERKVLLVLSDGGDNASRLSFDDVREKVLESNVVLYSIALVDPLALDSNPKALRNLANVTGGLAFEPEDPALVGKALRTIADDVRSRYTLAYSPADSAADGRLKRVRVAVHAPGRGDLRVRTRTGYIAGQPAPITDVCEVAR